jgi:hypothetical protein
MKQLEELLWNTAKADAGITVFYKRGGERMELTVVPGAGGNDSLGFGGNRMQEPSKTFLAGVADLRNFYPPQKNDVIQFRETGKCYTVKSDATGAAFREIGAYGTMIQIHTVEA